MQKKLTSKEILHAIERIRQEYDHYIVRYTQTPDRKRKFEQRLREAELRRLDMTWFLGTEMQVVRDLCIQEEERIKQAELEALRPKRASGSFADRILAKLAAQIAPYPRLEIHVQASEEIERLFGTLDSFFRLEWPKVGKVVRTLYEGPRLPLIEDQFIQMTPFQGRLPKSLEYYRVLLSDKGVTMAKAGAEQKRLILEGASLLHNLYGLLADVLNQARPKPEERELLSKTLDYLLKALKDFRLTEMKRP